MNSACRILLALSFMVWANLGSAHALDPGFLDIRQLSEGSWRIHWRKPDVNGKPMEIDANLPDQCSPLSGPEPVSDSAAWTSTWVADCEAGFAGQTISIEGLEAQRNDVLLRFQPLGAEATTLRFTPSRTVMEIPGKPTVWMVLTSYFRLGFEHILEGWDHLLFVFALFILVRDPWRLVGAVTAFTVAHSITLALATLGFLRVPGPPVEAVIALSIVFLALEILNRSDDNPRLSEQQPWIVCFCFGLLHGLGFAGALSEIGLPPDDIPSALLAFNLGVEAGQLAFIGVLICLISGWRLMTPVATHRSSSVATVVTAYGIGGLSMFWLVERVSNF